MRKKSNAYKILQLQFQSNAICTLKTVESESKFTRSPKEIQVLMTLTQKFKFGAVHLGRKFDN